MIDRSSNLTRILPKLKAKGLVDIARSESDRREYEIRLTPAALPLLEEIHTQLVSIGDKMTGLTVSEAFHLNALLDKMREVE
jgi:DNA-binding MarR family transcriptional regulator